MALNFRPYPNERPSAPEYVQQWNQGLNQLGDTFLQGAQLRQQRDRQELLDRILAAEEERKKQQSDYTFGQPINPDISVARPAGIGMSQYMPGGQGQVATGSPLIEQFNQWRASNYPKEQTRPEYMPALGAEERRMLFKRDNPEPPTVLMSPYQQESLDLRRKEFAGKQEKMDADLKASQDKRDQEAKANSFRANNIISKIDSALGKVGMGTTGIGSFTSKIPGTTGADLAADLQTIQANLGFEQLAQMKAQSRAGASGLGALSDNEMQLLVSALNNLKQSQSPTQLRQNLLAVKQHYQNLNQMEEGIDPYKSGGANSSSTGKIRVRNKLTGQTGSISEQYFDPNKYERI